MDPTHSTASLESIKTQLTGLYEAGIKTPNGKALDAFVTQLLLYGLEGGNVEAFSSQLNQLFELIFPQAPRADLEDVARLREIYSAVSALPYPPRYSVSPHWGRISKQFPRIALLLRDPRHIVCCGQLPLSGFDHRYDDDAPEIDKIVHAKLRFIQNDYGADHSQMEESVYAIPSSVRAFADKKYSTIFLTHLQFFERIEKLVGKQSLRRVMEIGGGYGALARVFHGSVPGLQYVIVDLMSSIVFSYTFLRLNFPIARILIVDTNAPDPAAVAQADFILAPVQFMQAIKDLSYDVVINTCSLQEMNQSTADLLMDYIENTISPRYFYSFNYFLTPKQYLTETSGLDDPGQTNFICPRIDSKWRTIFSSLNTPGITLDCAGRNWLEILLQRDHESRPEDRAEWHFQEAKKYVMMSPPWFHHALAAVLSSKEAAHIHQFLDGVWQFMLSDGPIPNHIFKWEYASDPGNRQRYYYQLGEVLYLQSFLPKAK